MIRKQIQLTEEQAESLRRLASERGLSMAAVIREALDRAIGVDEVARRRERAIAAIGGFRSGLHDVSERHDDYLAEAFED
jgi:hypothetical protein